MALPVTLTGVLLNATNMATARVGPFRSAAGNIYGVFLDSATNTALDIYKATDPTDSFSQVATISHAAQILNWAAAQVGDDIHIAVVTAGNVVVYSKFSMASDTFTVSTETTGMTVTPLTDPKKCSIAVRSDGDVLVLYGGAHETL